MANGSTILLSSDGGFSGISESGIYRSIDGGTTFEHLSGNGLPIAYVSSLVVDPTNSNRFCKGGDLKLSILADRTNDDVVFVGGDAQPYPPRIYNGTLPNSIGANAVTGRLRCGNSGATTPRGSL